MHSTYRFFPLENIATCAQGNNEAIARREKKRAKEIFLDRIVITIKKRSVITSVWLKSFNIYSEKLTTIILNVTSEFISRLHSSLKTHCTLFKSFFRLIIQFTLLARPILVCNIYGKRVEDAAPSVTPSERSLARDSEGVQRPPWGQVTFSGCTGVGKQYATLHCNILVCTFRSWATRAAKRHLHTRGSFLQCL